MKKEVLLALKGGLVLFSILLIVYLSVWAIISFPIFGKVVLAVFIITFAISISWFVGEILFGK